MDRTARSDGLAEWYDRELATGPLAALPRDAALRLLGDGPGRLLDVGCGTGAHTAAFGERGWTVTAGLRAKVGATHLPLEPFVQAFLAAGLRIERFEELTPAAREYPYMVALGCRR